MYVAPNTITYYIIEVTYQVILRNFLDQSRTYCSQDLVVVILRYVNYAFGLRIYLFVSDDISQGSITPEAAASRWVNDGAVLASL